MMRDLLGRPLKNLRLSVTDRCNLRCSYCMPEAEYVWLPRQDILQFEEMSTLVDVFAAAGVDRIRLTGGEPLLRRDLPELVEMLAQKPAIRDLALTTNGVMLAGQSDALHRAGLHRLTVSLDTLRADRFKELTRFDSLPQVLAGIDEAVKTFRTLKLDSVIIRGTNDDELIPSSSSRAASARRFGSSNTWTSAGQPSGRTIASCRGRICWPCSATNTGPSPPSKKTPALRPIASGCPMARHSASSRRPPIRSAATATEAG
jgi:uncharacterized Fe-S cluster-containing radical SAM superfamily enzyme